MLAGGCVCGASRFKAKELPMRITICHCTWCQRRTGTAFGTECVFPVDVVSIEGASLSSYRHVSDISGRWVDQDFCSSCGSNLGLRLEAVPDIRSVSIGSFDNKDWIDNSEIPVRHVFTRSQLALTSLPDSVEAYEMHFRS